MVAEVLESSPRQGGSDVPEVTSTSIFGTVEVTSFSASMAAAHSFA